MGEARAKEYGGVASVKIAAGMRFGEIYEAVAGNDQLGALVGRFNGVLVDLKTLRHLQMNDATPADNMAAPAAPAALKRPSSVPLHD